MTDKAWHWQKYVNVFAHMLTILLICQPPPPPRPYSIIFPPSLLDTCYNCAPHIISISVFYHVQATRPTLDVMYSYWQSMLDRDNVADGHLKLLSRQGIHTPSLWATQCHYEKISGSKAMSLLNYRVSCNVVFLVIVSPHTYVFALCHR